MSNFVWSGTAEHAAVATLASLQGRGAPSPELQSFNWQIPCETPVIAAAPPVARALPVDNSSRVMCPTSSIACGRALAEQDMEFIMAHVKQCPQYVAFLERQIERQNEQIERQNKHMERLLGLLAVRTLATEDEPPCNSHTRWQLSQSENTETHSFTICVRF